MNPIFPEIKKNFGFGFMRLPMLGEDVDLPQTQKMVDTFMERGFNYFDTAHPYIQGKSELALKECLTSRYPRDSYVLTNKLSYGCFEGAEGIAPFLEEQLRCCGVDYFDIYLMHAMSAERHRIFQEMGAYDIVQQLKAAGKIRHVGISFHDTAEALDKILTDRPEIEVVQIQFNYADMEDPKVQSRACYEVCRKHNKPVIVMEPVKGGSLVNLPQEAKALMTGSPASYAIRFAAGFEGVMMVLSGMSDQQQMEDNLSYMADFQPLSDDEMETVCQVRTLYQAQNKIPCTSCRYCTDGCPAGIPIPDVFACMNDKAADRYAGIENNASACVGCGQCEAVCPQKLQIRKLLEETAKTFGV